MEKERVLIVQGGWPGHQPEKVAQMLKEWLTDEGMDVEVADTLDCLLDEEKLRTTDLVIPNWTMGRIGSEALRNLTEAVEGGTGLAGLHGGMGDAFREATEFQYMVGGQFVAHPGGDSVAYRVRIADPRHPITEGLADFEVVSELYYMHVDPAIRVLAETTAHNGAAMPVAWIKSHGEGRVFYCSLGHTPDVLRIEEVKTMVVRGMKWASRRGKERRG
ncbi:MAG: ThuA domain-containing protein [Planifilum fulgidum]